LELVREENRLLRDFAYNVDPHAINIHRHRFIEGEDESIGLSSVLMKKVNELIAKRITNKLSRCTDDEKHLLGQIQSEVLYMEG
jgi:hypothetical protein